MTPAPVASEGHVSAAVTPAPAVLTSAASEAHASAPASPEALASAAVTPAPAASEAHPPAGTGTPAGGAAGGMAGAPNAGLPAEYRDAVSRIVHAAEASEHDTAAALAEALERRVFTAHGAYAAASLEMRRLRAHVARLGGRHGLAAHLYQDVALRLLTTRGAADPEAGRAASNADACWRAIPDPVEARRVAPAIITLHGRLSGDAARRMRASAERRLARLTGAGAPAEATAAAREASPPEAAPAAADRSPYRLSGTESSGPAGASHAEATA